MSLSTESQELESEKKRNFINKGLKRDISAFLHMGELFPGVFFSFDKLTNITSSSAPSHYSQFS